MASENGHKWLRPHRPFGGVATALLYPSGIGEGRSYLRNHRRLLQLCMLSCRMLPSRRSPACHAQKRKEQNQQMGQSSTHA